MTESRQGKSHEGESAATQSRQDEIWRVEYSTRAYVDQTGRAQAGSIVHERIAVTEANRARAKVAEKALLDLMSLLDNQEIDLRDTQEWQAAAHVLGWDVDWADLYDR